MFIVKFMTTLNTIFQPFTSPFTLLEHVRSKEQLAAFGLPTAWVNTLTTTAELFFGRTSHTRYQQRCREHAAKSGHTLKTLHVIASATAAFKDKTEAWKVREDLCRMEPDDRELRRYARQRLEQVQPPEPRESRVTTRTYKDGKASMTITGDGATIADLKANIKDYADVEKLFDGNLSRQPAVTNVIVTLDELDEILDGDGEEVLVRQTNGTTITGAEMLTRVFASRGYALMAHPVKGPINLYNLSRFANEKQRHMAKLRNHKCAWPGCNKGADFVQVHHVQGWRFGGLTNMDNLVCLCKYHNRINDDARNGNGRGYIELVNGKAVWVPPSAYAPESGYDPARIREKTVA
ncbi:Endonuclease [Corynebacterium renale]|nr:Endonuclease [Corynebacterium renale]